MPYNYYNSNQGMINQLLRQKDNIDNLINQYQQMPQQSPIQNIINQAPGLEFEARILKENEDPMDIAVIRKTLFVDETNKKVVIKEVDGTISKTYDIVVPLDAKDQKILELETKLKEMEEKINAKYGESIESTSWEQEQIVDADGVIDTSTETSDKQSKRTTRRETSRSTRKNV